MGAGKGQRMDRERGVVSGVRDDLPTLSRRTGLPLYHIAKSDGEGY